MYQTKIHDYMRALGVKRHLTAALAMHEVKAFAAQTRRVPLVFNKTDSKSIGTAMEIAFFKFLREQYYTFKQGNSSKNLDFPDIQVDVKATSCTQPQSSIGFVGYRQAVYGIGYDLIVFIYEKAGSADEYTVNSVLCIDREEACDRKLVTQLWAVLAETQHDKASLVEEILANGVNLPTNPRVTLTPALQWRISYGQQRNIK